MSETVWIYKDDGTLQCDSGKEIPLSEMQVSLESIGATIIEAEKRRDCRPLITVCGAPTGNVNAYRISKQDWDRISSSVVGPLGFRLWTCTADSDAAIFSGELPWPFSIADLTSVRSHPTQIRELIGRPLRVYKEGDAITQDFRPNRVNIETNSTNHISDIWFG